MQTVCQTPTGTSVYLLEDDVPVHIGLFQSQIGDRRVSDLRQGTAMVYTGVTPPADWAGGRYSFDGLNWRVAHLVRAERALVEFGNAFLAQFFEGRLHAEPFSWERKALAANAMIAGNATEAQQLFLQDEVGETGEDASALATAISRNEYVFSRIAPKVTGIRRDIMSDLQALADDRDPAGNPPPYDEFQEKLDQAKARVMTAWSDLMAEVAATA